MMCCSALNCLSKSCGLNENVSQRVPPTGCSLLCSSLESSEDPKNFNRERIWVRRSFADQRLTCSLGHFCLAALGMLFHCGGSSCFSLVWILGCHARSNPILLLLELSSVESRFEVFAFDIILLLSQTPPLLPPVTLHLPFGERMVPVNLNGLPEGFVKPVEYNL